MSKLFTVTTRNGISETQGYFGESIIDVVENNILAIGQRAGLGNAAGFKLSDARIVPAQSGKGSTLVLTGTGSQLAHTSELGPQKTVHVDLPDADVTDHIFEIRS